MHERVQREPTHALGRLIAEKIGNQGMRKFMKGKGDQDRRDPNDEIQRVLREKGDGHALVAVYWLWLLVYDYKVIITRPLHKIHDRGIFRLYFVNQQPKTNNQQPIWLDNVPTASAAS